MSLRRLGLERIDLWQLHGIDPFVALKDQFGAIKDMQTEGLIGHVGISEVSVDELLAAQVALAWLLQHSPVMLPIPIPGTGTGSVEHLEEYCGALVVTLDAESIAELNDLVSPPD